MAAAKPKRTGRKPKQAEATVAAETVASREAEAEGEAAGEAEGEADAEADAAARLDMARKASTGDGSRLERPHADSNDDTINSAAASGMEVQQHGSRIVDSHFQQQPEEGEDLPAAQQHDVDGEAASNGVRVFNPVAPVSKPPHRLSRVTGRELVGSGVGKEGTPNNGDNDGPLHRDDSTFGEYMAALDRRSSSGGGVRLLNSSGTAHDCCFFSAANLLPPSPPLLVASERSSSFTSRSSFSSLSRGQWQRCQMPE